MIASGNGAFEFPLQGFFFFHDERGHRHSSYTPIHTIKVILAGEPMHICKND